MRAPRMGFSYLLKMFSLFFVAFALVQTLIFFLSKTFLPYQIAVDARGWISQTSLLVFIEVIATAFCAAVFCVLYVQHILGPLQRLVEDIKKMESSGICCEIKIRAEDKLFGLVEAINKLILNKTK